MKTHTLQEVFTVLSFQSNQSVSILVGYEEADALVHWRYPKTICMMVTCDGSATMFKNAGSSSELNVNTWFWATLNFGGFLGGFFGGLISADSPHITNSPCFSPPWKYKIKQETTE